MKDNLEKAFKEKLDQFEAPYDASAWESMNARLDAQQSAGGSSLLKWIAGSAAVITVVSLAVYFSIDNSQQNEVLKAENQINETLNSTEDSSEKFVSNDDNTSKKEDENTSSSENLASESNDVKVDENQNESSDDNTGSESNNETEPVESRETNNEGNTAQNNGSTEVQRQDSEVNQPLYSYVSGSISTDKICKGEPIVVRNNGSKNQIIKVRLNDKIVELRKAHVHTFKPTESGTIEFLNASNEVIDSKDFMVMELPSPDFNLKANIFEEGLPMVEAETYGDYESIQWSFDGQYNTSGIKAKHHFFSKGEHKVSLTVEDFNGCENTTTKKVRIEEDYNLMAVDAFRPNDMDPRNKVFMPIALTQRDVKFTLTIFDPRDNSVVFTTQDSNNGWDGRDERTGKMTPSETAYIWKVQLESDIPNERKVYAGTVVHD
tara:strand:- start:11747 stop:13048 length:1302 start_codon:yes stop_codon:yes gene_type:complete